MEESECVFTSCPLLISYVQHNPMNHDVDTIYFCPSHRKIHFEDLEIEKCWIILAFTLCIVVIDINY